jgi:hypothetical protein
VGWQIQPVQDESNHINHLWWFGSSSIKVNIAYVLRYLTLLATCILAVSSRGAPFQNGSFESPQLASGAGQVLLPGTNSLPGWNVGTNGRVELLNSVSTSISTVDGLQLLIFNSGNEAPGGTISQTFNTTAGQVYVVTFSVGRAGPGGGTMSLLAQVTSDTGASIGSLQGVSPATPGYGSESTFSFIASTPVSTLTFLDNSSTTGSVDLLLDDVSVTTNPECVTPPLGLVSWWRAESNTVDSASGNGGTVGGDSAYASGRVGQAFQFDGNGDGILVGNPPSLQLQSLTVEAWIKRTSTTQVSASSLFGEIIGYGAGGYVVGFFSDGRLFLSRNGVDSVNSTNSITDTNWHHIAVTKAGNTVVFYVDGLREPDVTYSTTLRRIWSLAR